ncbi:MAG: VanZ family protein [Candidatus Brocadiia bacterium]
MSPGQPTHEPRGPSEPRRGHLRRLFALWLPTLAVMAAIHVGSVWTAVRTEGPPIPHLDKVLHAGAYGLLAWLLARGMEESWGVSASAVAWLAFVAATVYGGLHEVLQGFAARTPDAMDLAADAAGAAAAAAAWWGLLARRSTARRPGAAP